MADIKTENLYYDDVALADRVNTAIDQSAEVSAADKATLATLLSDVTNGVTAKVIIGTGTYIKVKYLRGGKKLGVYKSRKYSQDEAVVAREYFLTNNASGNALSPGATLALTIDDNTILIGGTGQLTATLTRVDATTTDVTAKATYTNDGTNNISVTQAGVVTGVEGNAKATVTLTSDATAVADAATVTIGNKVYTAKTTLSTGPQVANEVLIGSTSDGSAFLANLKAAINGSAGSGTTYGSPTVAHTQVDAGTLTGTTLVITAKKGGTTANAYASTETSTHLSFGAATLTGGTAKTVIITATYGGVAGTRSTTID